MTDDEHRGSALLLQQLRAQGFDIALAGDGYLYPSGPYPLDGDIVDRVEAFLRWLGSDADDATIH